jgi:hypothetical protein
MMRVDVDDMLFYAFSATADIHRRVTAMFSFYSVYIHRRVTAHVQSLGA